MSEDQPLRLRQWEMFDDVVTITLNRTPSTLEEVNVNQAVRGFVQALAVSESTGAPESPGLNQKGRPTRSDGTGWSGT